MNTTQTFGAFLFCLAVVGGLLWASARDFSDEEINQGLEVERLQKQIARMNEHAITCRPPVLRERLVVEAVQSKGDKAPQILCTYFRDGGYGSVAKQSGEQWAIR